jgi:hypothetical protein
MNFLSLACQDDGNLLVLDHQHLLFFNHESIPLSVYEGPFLQTGD